MAAALLLCECTGAASITLSSHGQRQQRARRSSSSLASPPSHQQRASAAAVSRTAVVGFVHQPSSQQWPLVPPPLSQQQQLAAFPELPDVQQCALCEVLGVSPGDAQLLLLTCAAASSMSRAQLTESWRQLQQQLPVPPPQLLQALLQVPELLPQPQQTLRARLAAAAGTLGVPPARLVCPHASRTAELHWRLLVTPHERLVRQLEQLVRLLGSGLPERRVAALVCAEPQLLTVDAAALLSTIEALEQVCNCPLSRLRPGLLQRPRLLVRPAGELYKAAAGLQQLLRLSEDGLALVLRRSPAALLVPSGRFSELLQQLSLDLAVGEDEAADILLQEPQVLTHNPGAVSGVLSVLRSTFDLGTDELMQVVQFDPSILCFSPGDLAQSTRQFKRLAGSCKPWVDEFRHLMSRPVNVARALRIEPLRLQRLVFLSRTGLAATISLRTALTLSGRKFVGAYPQYAKWLAQHYSAGKAPRRYRPQAGAPASGSAGSSYEDEDESEEDNVANY